MSSNDGARRDVVVRLPVCVALIICALLVGGLIGVKLPFGSKPATVSRGTAAFKLAKGVGTFQANHGGLSALIPAEVAWVDRSGRREYGSLPSCLRRHSPDENVTQAAVEAGYTWLQLPDKGSVPVVGWIRCL